MTDAAVQAELTDFVEQYADAWDTHDADVLSGFFTDDADMMIGSQPTVTGVDAIRPWWATYFTRVEPDVRIAFAIDAARVISPDVAILNLTAAQGAVDDAPPLARATWVVVRTGNLWRVSALRAQPTAGGTREPGMRMQDATD